MTGLCADETVESMLICDKLPSPQLIICKNLLVDFKAEYAPASWRPCILKGFDLLL